MSFKFLTKDARIAGSKVDTDAHLKNLEFLSKNPSIEKIISLELQGYLEIFCDSRYLNSGEVATSIARKTGLGTEYHGVIGSLLLKTLQESKASELGLTSSDVIFAYKQDGAKCFHYWL